MKINLKNIVSLALPSILVIFLLSCLQDCATYQNQNNYDSSNQNNSGYDLTDLNNYGEWIQTRNYGNAWKPYVADGWTPFDNGYWTYANGNWTWISYEPFGWIVYHYGNWYDDPSYGWVWIPSSEAWSPARVTWVDYDNYVAWAPMPPARIKYGNPWETNQNRYWHVVKTKDFTNDNLHNVRVTNPTRNNSGSRKSTVERSAPTVQVIRNSTGRAVPEVKLQRQPVNVPKRKVEKVILPPPEAKKVEENSVRVKKEVLVPRDEYKKRETQRKETQTKGQDQKTRKR